MKTEAEAPPAIICEEKLWIAQHEAAYAKDQIDQVYRERNQVVALLSKLFPAGVARPEIPGWDPEWLGCVYIDLPTGQVSWHFHVRDDHLFAHLPPYTKPWDGHTTPEKYARVAAVASVVPWKDSPLPEDAEIRAAHPAFSQDPASDKIFTEALRLVGARRSKHSLVELVCWLLQKKQN